MPQLISDIFGGTLADRVGRRRVVLFIRAWGTFVSTCLSVLAFGRWIKVWLIIAISLRTSMAVSFKRPARMSIIPNTVPRPHLLNAICLNQFSVNSARIIGRVLAGYLIAILGVAPGTALGALGMLTALLMPAVRTIK